MHEMSLVLSILDIVTAKAHEEKAARINEIEIEIGQLAGIQSESLLFCFDAARKNTLAENALLQIIAVPAKGKCLDCAAEFPVEFYFSKCPECGSYKVNIFQGKDFKIRSINID
ncbi:MAG: hydrogenase maturation nickel metallochaperone HypA [Chlorobiales bacterium]|jgi:hydrogenase nickel incorporation protein HypA/HybF|nr:hydrogenase maturation nickel metallochaperone HypA [Chlorobiales bacterium]